MPLSMPSDKTLPPTRHAGRRHITWETRGTAEGVEFGLRQWAALERTEGDSGRMTIAQLRSSSYVSAMTTSVAIYTRLSSDTPGRQQTATKRQERDCRVFAQLRDWDVSGVYEDFGEAADEVKGTKMSIAVPSTPGVGCSSSCCDVAIGQATRVLGRS
jgi:hypothetical protein